MNKFKTNYKKVTSLLLVIIMLFSCVSFAYPSAFAAGTEYTKDGYTYTVSGSTAKIVAYTTSSSGKVTIPSKLNGYTVTTIGEEAFYACTTLTEIIIPNTVTKIEDYAFSFCISLKTCRIPSSVKSIGKDIFCFNDSVVVECVEKSVAWQYAKDNGLNTTLIPGVIDGGVIGIFKDYAITVILNGTDSYISNVTVDDTAYDVEAGVLPFVSSKDYDKYENKEVYIRITDGLVSDMMLTSLDTDKDGLYDYWEKYGADYNKDCVVDLPVNEMGADYKVPDVFVEVDCMDGYTSTTQALFDDVAAEFKRHNINLHIDAGATFVDYVTKESWGNYPGGSGANTIPYVNEFNTFDRIDNIANVQFTANRRNVFHYCVFAECLGGAGGIAYLNHQLFTVLGTMSDWAKGAAFMHELGHNLGLQHGGCDDFNNKPNYLSNMNYIFAYSDDLAYKYSDYLLPTINEQSLNEQAGVDPNGLTAGTGIHTALMVDGSPEFFIASRTPLDYNGDGDTTDTNVRVDLSDRYDALRPDGTVSYDVLRSQNDWNVLNFTGESIGDYIGTVEFTKTPDDVVVEEMTNEELRENGMFPEKAEGTPIVSIVNYDRYQGKSVDYKTTMIFSYDTTWLPADAEVHWFYNNNDMGTQKKLTVEKATNNFSVQAKIVKDGKVIAASKVESISVKNGFFNKIIAFFKGLFGLLPTIEQ